MPPLDASPRGSQRLIGDSDLVLRAAQIVRRAKMNEPLPANPRRRTTESDEPPKRWVGILRYPSLEDALAFDSSPEYEALKPIRDQSTRWRSFVVEGLPNQ
jgi:uncharacterized protein (DUF1330 family)